MDRLGTDFNAKTGSVMSQDELEAQRRKRGECTTCGRKCFQKKRFRMIPLTEDGMVLNGRCLNCKPLANQDVETAPVTAARPTREDLRRFEKSQSNLNLQGPGMRSSSSRRITSSSSSRQLSSRTLPGPTRQTSSRTISSGASSVSSGPGGPLPGMNNAAESVATAPERPSQSGPLHMIPSTPRSDESRLVSIPSTPRDDARLTLAPISHDASPSISPARSVPSYRSVRTEATLESHHMNGHYHDDPYDDYDNYSLRSDRAPQRAQRKRNGALDRSRSSDEVQLSSMRHAASGVMERRLSADSYHSHRTASMVPDEDPYTMAASHPAGAALVDYYRQVFQESQQQELWGSQRSLTSHHTHQTHQTHTTHTPPEDIHQYHASGRSLLDRGGAIAMAHSTGGSTRSLRSTTVPLQSSRSLESRDSFYDDSELVPPSPIHRDRGLEESDHTTKTGHSISHSHLHVSGSHVSGGHLIGSSQTSSSMLSMTVSHRDTVGLERIRAAGTDFVQIINIMHDYPESAAVQAMGMQELSNLHFSPVDNDTFLHIGAIQVILEGMKTYPLDVELQISGCRAMWNASGTRNNQIAFVEAGALDVILFAMSHYLPDADVQEQALATLANLAAVDTNVQVMIDVGAVTSIVEGMNKHVDNVHVQMKGCSAITNLASHLTPLKRTIMDLGAGGSVIIAMVLHPNDASLQEKALRALRNLSANCDENKIELASSGGIDAVISAMQVHRDEVGVQEAGAWTLCNLAGNADNKVLIGDYGGVDVTVRAMWVHSENAKVQEWCCRALFTLSLDAQNANLIDSVGGVSAVVNAMQAHVDNAIVQEMGCAVLCNLALDQQAKVRIVEEEALDAIVLAMVLHSEDLKVQERGCQVLLQLAVLENCTALQASNIGELARTAAERFPGQCEELANMLLHTMDCLVAEYNQLNA